TESEILALLMCMMGEERAQQLAMEETLRQTQTRLDDTAGHQNPAPAPPPASNPVLAKPQLFYGTPGDASEVFFGHIGLHAVTYPERFPTKGRFAILSMRDYAENLSQPYLEKLL
ncbi:uncharacterized protein VP01_1992g1, partial [Puccinia sorghi]